MVYNVDLEKSVQHVHLEQDAKHVAHFLKMHRQIRDREVHQQLLNDLV